jgi:hypothetical protein
MGRQFSQRPRAGPPGNIGLPTGNPVKAPPLGLPLGSRPKPQPTPPAQDPFGGKDPFSDDFLNPNQRLLQDVLDKLGVTDADGERLRKTKLDFDQRGQEVLRQIRQEDADRKAGIKKPRKPKQQKKPEPKPKLDGDGQPIDEEQHWITIDGRHILLENRDR